MNERDIKALKFENKEKEYGLGNGLYLRVRKSSKTYIIRKKVNYIRQVITLGQSPVMSLKDAKFKAMEYSRQKDVSKNTMSELIVKYWDEVEAPRSKVPKQVQSYLNIIDGAFGKRKLIDIKRAMLVGFIQRYSKTNGARTSDRVRSYLRQLFGYALELGWVESSPMEGVSIRVTGYTKPERKRVLTDDEIKMVWAWKHEYRAHESAVHNADVLKFLLFTGLRISEAFNGYIDGDKFRVDDTKGSHSKDEKRPHWVYLPESVKALLPLHGGSHKIQTWLNRRLRIHEGYKKGENFTCHDLRRTFATRANNAGVDFFIVERALNHKLPGMQSVYNLAEYEEERINCALVVEKEILKILEKPMCYK